MLRQSEQRFHSQPTAGADTGPEYDICLAKLLGHVDTTPSLERSTSDIDIDFLPAICPPFPPPHSISGLPTPYHETPPDLSTAAIEGPRPSLELDDSATVSQSLPKAALSLRLPSFQMLGIAAPHPNDVPLDFEASIVPVGGGPLSAPNDPLHTMNPIVPVLNSPLNNFVPRLLGSPVPAERRSPSHSAVRQYVLTQTPPDDNGVMNWTTDLIKSTASDQRNNQGGSHRIPGDADATHTRSPNMALTPPSFSFDSDNGPWISQALPSIRKLAPTVNPALS